MSTASRNNTYDIWRRFSQREAYECFRSVKEHLASRGIAPEPEMIREFRQAMHDRCNHYHIDPLSVPLSEGWRTVLRYDGESGTDYRILPEYPDDPWTDEELDEYIEDSPVYCGPVRSPYDCSGQRFTWYTAHRRTPAGIVLIHAWSYDI